MINIVLIIIITICVYYIFNWINSKEYEINHEFDESKCKLDHFNIDNMHIIKRDKEYSRLINKLIDEKKIKFTDKEIEILKNNYQFYNIKDIYNIQNISNNVQGSCKNILLEENKDSPINNNDNKNYNKDIDADLKWTELETKKNKQFDINKFDNIDIPNLRNKEYNQIIKELNSNLNNTKIEPKDVAVLTNKDYMKNYYYDVFGENIQASLQDYFADYYSRIDNNKFKDECVAVNLKSVPNYLLIPDQYDTQKYLSNAYNIDYQRLVNPYTVY